MEPQDIAPAAPIRCALAGEPEEIRLPEGGYPCPVCQAVIPPEHLGRKIWCRRCGYLESCCNPV